MIPLAREGIIEYYECKKHANLSLHWHISLIMGFVRLLIQSLSFRIILRHVIFAHLRHDYMGKQDHVHGLCHIVSCLTLGVIRQHL